MGLKASLSKPFARAAMVELRMRSAQPGVAQIKQLNEILKFAEKTSFGKDHNLREGMSFDDSIFKAGIERFRAIFLTSITTMAGLAPIILEKSFQAQLLKPMAISIAYGIGYATFLTLILLPILISFTNSVKVNFIWILNGKKPNKRDVEAPVVEQNREIN